MMTSSRPYLIRALYEWIVDNGMTPHILVDAERDDVQVPRQYVREGRIVLNINPGAVQALELVTDAIEFQARFQGTPHRVFLPAAAVIAIYARENDQGMVFGDEPAPPPENPTPSPPEKAKRPSLKVVK